MAAERTRGTRLHLTVEVEPHGDLLVTLSGLRCGVATRAAGRISELARSGDPIEMLEAAALGATEVVESAMRLRRQAEEREYKLLAVMDEMERSASPWGALAIGRALHAAARGRASEAAR